MHPWTYNARDLRDRYPLQLNGCRMYDTLGPQIIQDWFRNFHVLYGQVEYSIKYGEALEDTEKCSIGGGGLSPSIIIWYLSRSR